jgi:phosphotriesterase-related protein
LNVQTVRGSLAPSELGITLSHEHLLFDLTCYMSGTVEEATRKRLAELPVRIENLGEIRLDILSSRDNLLQLDVGLAIEELMYFKMAGGKTIVDCTTLGLARDVRAVRAISEATGVNIIAGSGYYVGASHPKNMDEKTVDEISQQMIQEITVGVGDTGIKCGILGEIGTSWPMTKNEEKVLRAAGRAAHKTGAPVNVHVWPFNRYHHQVLDILNEEGANLERVVLSHIDEGMFDTEYPVSLLKRGCYVEFDTFGAELYFGASGQRDPSDAERVQKVSELVKLGYASNVLISHDVCYKIMLKRFGGYGYDHLLKDVVPMFRRAGVSDDQIRTIMVENSARLLPFSQ